MTGLGPYWIDPNDNNAAFPDVSLALIEPNGLLAVGGTLSPQRLMDAYSLGIFPWFGEGQPILWWSPDPRAILFTNKLNISRSMQKVIKKSVFTVTFDNAFEAVINACAEPRVNGNGTWITQEVMSAYVQLHNLGLAHSIEAWFNGKLVGGLYGVSIGKIFFGESMFSRVNNASKVAFIYLVRQLQKWNFLLVDCQVSSQHLESLGARDISRSDFITIIRKGCKDAKHRGQWKIDAKLVI